MNIKTKYEIGQHIWVVYENQGEISLYDDVIDCITVDEEGVYFILKESGIDHKESDLVLYDDKEALVNKIESLINEIRIKENNMKLE